MKLFLKNDDDLLLISKTKKLKQLNTDNWSLNYTAAFDVEPLIPIKQVEVAQEHTR